MPIIQGLRHAALRGQALRGQEDTMIYGYGNQHVSLSSDVKFHGQREFPEQWFNIVRHVLLLDNEGGK
jgi:hypothetical protein